MSTSTFTNNKYEKYDFLRETLEVVLVPEQLFKPRKNVCVDSLPSVTWVEFSIMYIHHRKPQHKNSWFLKEKDKCKFKSKDSQESH